MGCRLFPAGSFGRSGPGLGCRYRGWGSNWGQGTFGTEGTIGEHQAFLVGFRWKEGACGQTPADFRDIVKGGCEFGQTPSKLKHFVRNGGKLIHLFLLI